MHLKKVKIFFLILRALIRRNLKLILLVFAGAALIATIFLNFGVKLLTTNLVSEGIVGTYQKHDIPEYVTKLLSIGLVNISHDGKAVPGLAESWEVSEDAKTFTFKLKPNLFWSDGMVLKAPDIGFNIPDVEVSYPQENQIQFKLKGSFSPFPTLLSKPVFKKDSMIGVGPYKLVSIKKSQVFLTKLILEPIDPKTHPQVVIRFYPNEKTAATAFSIGEVNSILGPTDLKLFNFSPIVKFSQRENYGKAVAILYNTKDKILENRSVRQALSYSAPEAQGETLAHTSIPPTSWAYLGEDGLKDANDYLGNTDAAKAALKRAKSTSNEELLQKEIVLTTTGQYENFAREIVSAWNNLGLKAVVRVESGIPQNFQALLIALSIPADPDQYSLWHSTQASTNITGYNKARVDKDLEDARKTTSEADRRLKYQDFQKTLLEDTPAVFLYFPKLNFVYLKKAEDNLNKILMLQLPR